MGKVTKEAIIARLIKDGTQVQKASMYADLYLEYQEATANILENGVIVQHPRTMNPIENPYLSRRDKSRKALLDLKMQETDWLWQ
jgi:phage terminase small subunit